MRVEFRQVEQFIAVADELNFSRAASRAHVVQSALSTSISKLEKELGVELFDRSKRQIKLTSAGEAFLEQARELRYAAKRAKDSVSPFRGQLSGTVELGTLMSTGTLDLPATLARFHRGYPLIRVRLRQSTAGSAGHLSAVADGSLDLALVSTPERPSSVVQVQPLATEPMVFVCRPDHAFANRHRLPIADLSSEDLIQFGPGWGVRRLLDEALDEAGITAHTPYQVADYQTAAGLIRHRLGTAVMPATEAHRFTDLLTIELTPEVNWSIYIASAGPQHTSPAAAQLADTLVRQAAGGGDPQ